MQPVNTSGQRGGKVGTYHTRLELTNLINRRKRLLEIIGQTGPTDIIEVMSFLDTFITECASEDLIHKSPENQ